MNLDSQMYEQLEYYLVQLIGSVLAIANLFYYLNLEFYVLNWDNRMNELLVYYPDQVILLKQNIQNEKCIKWKKQLLLKLKKKLFLIAVRQYR